MKFLKNGMRAVLLLMAAAGIKEGAYAQLVGSVFDNGNGIFTYSYTIDNRLGAFDVVAFSLEFPVSFSAIDWDQDFGVTVPSGWDALVGIPTTGLSAQDFFSFLPSADVAIGSSLSGFSFNSALQPGQISYLQFGAAGEVQSGSVVGVVGAVPVPEPATWAVGALLVSFTVFRWLGRRPRANS